MDPLAALEPVEGLWAVVTIAGREVRGSLVGFSGRIAVVAFDRAQPVASGESLRLRLGVDAGNASDNAVIVGRVLHVLLTKDGRPAVAFTLPDTDDRARRLEARVPFGERVELVVCDSRVGGDAHQRARGIDLSPNGMSVCSERELPPMTALLVRLRLPRAAAPLQFRAHVRWCRPNGNQFHCGLVFSGLKPTQAREIAATVLELAAAEDDATAPGAATYS